MHVLEMVTQSVAMKSWSGISLS